MNSQSADEQAIFKLIRNWSDALERKDIDSMMLDYHPNAVLYDACPPYKTVGPKDIQHLWEQCLPHFPDSFKSEHRDLEIRVDGNVAFAHGLHHFIPKPEDHPCGQTWMRLTIGYVRVDGAWKVIHEHVSIPFNPMNNQAWYIPDPDNLDMPDYSGSPCGKESES